MSGAQFQALLAAVEHGPWTTLFVGTNSANATGNTGLAERNLCALSVISGNQLRVTFQAASTGANFTVDHVSIAILGAATAPNSQATPTEVLFGGVSGFNIAAGASITSDPVTLPFHNTDSVIVCFDNNASSGGSYSRNDASAGTRYFKAASASYNLATVSGFTSVATTTSGLNKIEGRT